MMADCLRCATRITSFEDGERWVHLAEGHDDHEPRPARGKTRRTPASDRGPATTSMATRLAPSFDSNEERPGR